MAVFCKLDNCSCSYCLTDCPFMSLVQIETNLVGFDINKLLNELDNTEKE